MTLRAAALGVLLALALSGCGSGSSPDDLAAMSPTSVKQQVERYAGSTLAGSGMATYSKSAANVTGCPRDNGRSLSDPDEVFYVQGIYQLPVPEDQVTATLEKVRFEWQQAGYTLPSTSPATGLSATTPDQYRLDLSPDQLAGLSLHIASPCYRTAN